MEQPAEVDKLTFAGDSSQKKNENADMDLLDNFTDIEHQAAMALLIDDDISSAEGKYTTLKGYTSPPADDLPLMITNKKYESMMSVADRVRS